MSYEEDRNLDRLTADLEKIAAREALQTRVHEVRAGILMPDRIIEDTRTVSRRFSIITGPNQALPVDSERLDFAPGPRQSPIEDVDSLRIYHPLLTMASEDDRLAGEELIDSRFTFFEGMVGGEVWLRFLLSSEGLRRYADSRLIAVVETGDDVIYRTRTGGEHEQDPLYTAGFEQFAYPVGQMANEGMDLNLLNHFLDSYEPRLQSNEN